MGGNSMFRSRRSSLCPIAGRSQTVYRYPVTLSAAASVAAQHDLFVLATNDPLSTAAVAREWPASATVVAVIGRMSTSDIVLSHPTISRQHARFEILDGRCTVTDLGSTCGTRVNGQRITGSVPLNPGDTVSVGAVEFGLTRRRTTPTPSSLDLLAASGTVVRAVVPAAPSADVASTADAQAPDAASQAARFKRLLSAISDGLLTAEALPDVLERVVSLTFDNLPAARAVLLLRDSSYDALTPRVARLADGTHIVDPLVSRTIVNHVMRERVAILGDDAAHDERLDASNSIHSLAIRSFMCAPLWNRSEVNGVLHVDSPRSRRFTDDDLTVFSALANYAAARIDQARIAERLSEETRRRERLQRYHSPAVVGQILKADHDDIETCDVHVRTVTVMFADIVGFTAMSEQLSPVEVAATLNDYFAVMTEVVFDNQGTLDKYIGDGLLAVFGAPIPQEHHAAHALRAAVEMRQALHTLNQRRQGPPLQMRIAVHSGPVLTGDMGSPKRREFTVLGDTVNTASRLESAVAAPNQIVTTAETVALAGNTVRVVSLGPTTLRGRRQVVDVFAVMD